MSFSKNTFTNIFGEISSEFNVYTIEDIASDEKRSIISGPFGSNISSKYFTEHGVPVIRGNNLTEDNTKFIDEGFVFVSEEKAKELNTYADVDDLVFTAAGTIGQVGIIPENSKFDRYVISNKQLRVTLDLNKVNQHYAYYWFSSKLINKYIKQLNTGSTIPLINLTILKGLPIPLPSKDLQDKIANIIINIDKKIEINKKINKNLDDILDSIFKENFIKEFDNDNNDWKIKNIGELPLIITDYVANGSFASLKENVTILDYEEYAYFIRNTDLKSKSFQKFVNKHSYDFLKKSSLFGNEVIISNVGDVGSVFLCPFLDKPMTLGNNMILVKSRDDAINLNFYLFLLFRSNYGQYLISTITAGSVQSKFNKTEFKSLELTMPNDELIIKFNNLVSPIFDYKNKISDEIVRLTKLRDTLLPKLMSGEIDVSKINCDLELKYNYMRYLFNQIHTPMSKSVV